ncbi:MAG TPA: NAD-dependent epimerase/dehydratase family protein, partial [Propionibacteriaceae bacterium]|nr:NAD-dependent epimerase/dehydratase family protein [Propionibacteriaceae bacterium]
RALAARGDAVSVLQRRPAGLGLPEVLADVADADAVRDAVAGQDAVVHLAAKVGYAGTWAEYASANIAGTRSVVDACRATGVGRLVHVSSPSVAHAGSSLVGAGAGPADPARARGAYARSKAAAEELALAANHPDLAVTAIRPHLVWGPGDQQLIGRIVERARTGRLVLVGTGAALMDSTFTDNAVAALVAGLDRVEVAAGRALVVSNGEPRPVAELLTGICAAAGVPAPHRRVPARLAYAAGLVAEGLGRIVQREPPMTRFLAEQLSTAHWFDQRETRAVLDWAPAITLDEGLDRLAAAYRRSRPVSTPVAG